MWWQGMEVKGYTTRLSGQVHPSTVPHESHLRSHSCTLTRLEVCHPLPHFNDQSTRFMSHHHGGIQNEVPNASTDPVVHVRATDPHRAHAQENLCTEEEERRLGASCLPR